MRSLEETLKDAERWNGFAPGSLERDVLYHLREYKRTAGLLDDLLMKTAALQCAIDQHMNAIKELDRLRRMYKRELRAAEEIRMKK